MNYDDNVRAAAAALDHVEDSGWEVCRLTFESTLSAGRVDEQRLHGKVSMEQWCADVRATRRRKQFSVGTGRLYRLMWEKYGRYPGSDLPEWDEAYAEIRGGKIGERLVAANFRQAIAHASPEQKREAFATLAREPEVIADLPTSTEVFTQIVRDNPIAVQEAWKDTETNVGLSTARWQARDELHEPLREAIRDTEEIFQPKDATLDRRIFLADVATKVEQWTRELNGIREFLEFSDDVDRIRRWATRQALDRLVDAATACRDALPSSSAEQEPAKPVTKRKLA